MPVQQIKSLRNSFKTLHAGLFSFWIHLHMFEFLFLNGFAYSESMHVARGLEKEPYAEEDIIATISMQI